MRNKLFWLAIALMAILVLAGCVTPGNHTVDASVSFDGGAPMTANVDLEVADTGIFTATVYGSVAPLTAGTPAVGSIATATPAPAVPLVCDPLSWDAQAVIDTLVPIERERAFVAVPRLNGNQWIVETAKTGYDSDNHPCCGPQITWSLFAGGEFDYWGGFAPPTGTGFTTVENTDPTSGHSNWNVFATTSSTGKFKSDGVSWTPCPAGTAAMSAPAAATATPAPAATGPTIDLGFTADEIASWTGVAGWVPADRGEFTWHSDSPLTICLTADFPGGGFLKYGRESSPGTWVESYVTVPDTCTLNTVADVTFVPGSPG